jgi:hypothetical protein
MKSNFSKIIFSSFRAAKGEWMSTPGCARGYSYRALSEPVVINTWCAKMNGNSESTANLNRG